MMSRLVLMFTIVSLLCAGTVALAVDWSDYAAFRHVSSLPGNGFGVDQNGDIGFGGAYHMNVPCAYTPTKGNYSVGYNSGSNDSKIRLKFEGHDTNGTAHVGLGLGNPGHGLWVAEIFVDEDWRNTVNLQWQVADESVDRPAVAIGVLDVFDQRMKKSGINGGARSWYVTATRKIEKVEDPLFVTLGIGDGRFSGPFAAVSWYPGRDLNVGFEYDGRIPTPHAAVDLYDKDNVKVDMNLSWANFDRPAVGFSFAYFH